MIRRSFRFGLLVGVLAGLAVAAVKLLGSRPGEQGAPLPSGPWPPLDHDPAVPARPHTRLDPDPDAPRPGSAATPPVERPTPPRAEREVPAASEPTGPRPPAHLARRPLQPAAEEADPANPGPPPGAAAEPARKPAAKKGTTKGRAPARAWVEPKGDVCPTTHPVKAKLSSKIFHVPGGLSYARTKPDRCYRDPAAAEGDGLRPAKR